MFEVDPVKFRRLHVEENFIYLIFFLTGLSFYGKTYEYIYILFAYIFLRERGKRIDRFSLLLFFLGIFFSFTDIFISLQSVSKSIVKCMAYFALYYIGKGMQDTCNSKKDTEQRIFDVFFFFSLGNWLRFILDICLSWDSIKRFHRWLTDIWMHEETTATICAGWCIPLACVFYYVLSTKKSPVIKRLIVIFEVITACVFNIMTGTRLFLFLLFIGVLCTCFFDFTKVRKCSSMVIKTTCLFLAGGTGCILFFLTNMGGFRNLLLSSTLFMRLTKGELSGTVLNDNGRLERMLYVIQNIDKVFWGGGYCEQMGYLAHNWVIQILDTYGFFSTIFFIFILCILINRMLSSVLKTDNSAEYKIIVFSILIVLILYGMFEPVLSSNNIIVSFLFLSYGMMNQKGRNKFI